MRLSDKQGQFTQNIAKFLLILDGLGYKVTFGDFYRSSHEQARLYKAKLSKVTKGYHNKRLAADLIIFIKGEGTPLSSKEDLTPIGDIWERLDKRNKWGGYFTNFFDGNHFEMRV